MYKYTSMAYFKNIHKIIEKFSMAVLFPNTMLVVTIVLACWILRTRAQISTPCTSSMMSTFTPCLNYVTGSSGAGSSPTQDCCDSLKSLMGVGMDCACLIITGNVPVSLPPFVNRNLAISLPKMCHNSVPVQCKATGDPLPAPGPALFGPSQAPASNGPEPEVPTPTQSSDGPSEIPLSPTGANPGIRPVVNGPASDSNHQVVISWSSYIVVLVFLLGIMS